MGGIRTMKIKEVDYPVTGKRKFNVIHKGKEYTCYLHPFMSPGFTVVTGSGNDKDYKNITGTHLSYEIFLQCK